MFLNQQWRSPVRKYLNLCAPRPAARDYKQEMQFTQSVPQPAVRDRGRRDYPLQSAPQLVVREPRKEIFYLWSAPQPTMRKSRQMISTQSAPQLAMREYCSGQKKPDCSWGRLSEAQDSWGSGNLEWGGFGWGVGQGRSVYKQPETEVDDSCHSWEGSK